LLYAASGIAGRRSPLHGSVRRSAVFCFFLDGIRITTDCVAEKVVLRMRKERSRLTARHHRTSWVRAIASVFPSIFRPVTTLSRTGNSSSGTVLQDSL